LFGAGVSDLPNDSEVRPEPSRVALLVLLFCAFAVVLKLPSLRFIHAEPDEIVYWSVARNMVERGEYTLRGAEIAGRLSPAIYDRPLFHHPPLYPMLLTPFVALNAQQSSVVISWLGHLLCVAAVGMIGWAVLDRGREDMLWLALLGVATDPLLTFASRKLWIDALLAGLVALAIALVWTALVSRRRRLLLVMGGLVLGLAGLAKLPGLIVAPVMAMLVWSGGGSLRQRLLDLVQVAAPCVLLVLPWLVVFVTTYGTLTPTLLRPDEWTVRHYPFLAFATGRPWYYYAAKLALAEPLSLVSLALLFRKPGGLTLAKLAAPSWLLLWLVVYTIQSATGYGFQMRHLAPLAPSLYVMLLFCGQSRGGLLRPVIALALTYGAMGATVYLLTERLDELLSLPELAGLLRL
jgi:4-amino-4-deoxy-L-arabinose transferase-like glycosyltransferase